jgi:DNA repair exonuclease SbcCD ATPase subunit
MGWLSQWQAVPVEELRRMYPSGRDAAAAAAAEVLAQLQERNRALEEESAKLLEDYNAAEAELAEARAEQEALRAEQAKFAEALQEAETAFATVAAALLARGVKEWLVKGFHPDGQRAKRLTEAQLDELTDTLQKINAAYDVIKRTERAAADAGEEV